MSKQVYITSGNILGDTKKVFDKSDELKKAFSREDSFDKNDDKTEKQKRVDRKAYEKSKIQDRSWEEVRSSSLKVDRVNEKQIGKSGNIVENQFKNELPDTKPSLFNSNPFLNIKNEEFTEHIISSGKTKRKEERNRKNSGRDFEISKATNTSDIPANMMGFTPHRTSLTQGELPRLPELPEIKLQKENITRSIEAGMKVAEIYKEIETKKHEEFLKDANDVRKWQDYAASKIEKNYTKKMDSTEKPFNFGNPNEYRESSYKEDLSQIFKKEEMSNNEVNIKKDRKDIENSTRKHRSDDRSWESTENSKSKKF